MKAAEMGGRPPEVDPTTLRVLVIDSKTTSREHVVDLLHECSYKVTSVRTANEALELLAASAAEEASGSPAFDLLLKEHEPERTVNACRLLGRVAQSEALQRIPVVVMSSSDEREAVLRCLHLGAADYLVKPLRVNELRNIWTRVWWHRAMHAPGGRSPQALEPAVVAGITRSLSGGDGTIIDDDDEPTSKEDSVPDRAQRLNIGRQSANRNSTTKPGSGRLAAADGSNTANGHGSNTGIGASSTHMYASDNVNANGGFAPPLAYGRSDGSGGSGDDGGDGSGQGSGSGNEDLAARRQLASDLHEMRGNATATAGAAKATGIDLATHGGNGSNGNSGVGNPNSNDAAAALQDTQETPEGGLSKRAASAPVPASGQELQVSTAAKLQSAATAPAAALAAPSTAAAAAPCPLPGAVGFRAWVAAPQQAGASIAGGLKRSGSALPPPAARSVRPKRDTELAVASSAGGSTPLDRLVSGTGTGTDTGASDGTRFGNSAGPGTGDLLRRASSTHLSPQSSQPMVSSTMPPPPAAASQLPGLASPPKPHATAAAQSSPRPAAGNKAAWDASTATAMQQLQATAVAVAAQQQMGQQHQQAQAQAAQQQQQQQQQQQLSAQLRNAYGNGGFQYGGMPPHMVHPNFAPSPFGAWGQFAAAAAQQQQRAQGPAQTSAAMQQQFAMGQQAMQQQQQQQQQQQMNAALLAGYPGYLMNSLSMGGGFPSNFQAASWAQQAQASAFQQAAVQAQLQQQAASCRLPPKPPGAAPNASAPCHPHQASLAAPEARAATPNTMLDSGVEISTPGPEDDAGTGGRPGALPTQRERRAQALSKYKQKRKNLCFTKKIRYESRKQLAQARPRVKGQFVKTDSNQLVRFSSTGEVEVLAGAAPDGADMVPPSPAALLAAVEAGTAQILQEEEAEEEAQTLEQGEAASDADSDVNSPRTTAMEAPMARQTRSHSGKGATSAALPEDAGRIASGFNSLAAIRLAAVVAS